MKKWLKPVLFVLLLILVLVSFQGATDRLINEKENDSIAVVLDYYDMKIYSDKMKLDFFEVVDEIEGVSTILLDELTIRTYESMGQMAIYYYYELENSSIRDSIPFKKNQAIYDNSLVLIPENEEFYEFVLSKLNKRFNDGLIEAEYNNRDVIILNKELDERVGVSLGFDEKVIQDILDNGYDVALSFRNSIYGNYKFLDEYDSLLEKYPIKMYEFDFYDFPGYPDNLDKAYEIFSKHDAITMIHADYGEVSKSQVSGFEDYLIKIDNNVVRTFYLKRYLSNSSLGVEDLYLKMLRAAIDRGNRIFVIRPMMNSKSTYTENYENTKKLLEKFVSRLDQKYSFDSNVLIKTSFNTNGYLNKIATSLAIVLVALFVLIGFLNKRKMAIFLTLGFLVFYGALYIVAIGYIGRINAFFGTVAFSAFFIDRLFALVDKTKNIKLLPKYAIFLGTYLAIGTMNILISITSLSSKSNFIGFESFMGVKLSLVIPLLVFLIYFIKYQVGLKNLFYQSVKFLNRSIRYIDAIIVALALVIVYVYLIRSGNQSTGMILPFEEKMREFFEHYLLYRPRTKEFAIGYPALLLLVYLYHRYQSKIVLLILGLLTTIGFTSFVNTYSHVNAHVLGSIQRSIYALIIGIFIGIIAILITIVIEKLIPKIKEHIHA